VAGVGLERDPVPALLAVDIPKLIFGHQVFFLTWSFARALRCFSRFSISCITVLLLGRPGCGRAGAIPRYVRPNRVHGQPSSLPCTYFKALTASLLVAFLAPAQISIAPPPLSQDEVPVFTAGRSDIMTDLA
jgi:hypothetical protein